MQLWFLLGIPLAGSLILALVGAALVPNAVLCAGAFVAGPGFAVGTGTAAWLLTGAVAALQTVLAVTGYCLGCRLYFLRWYGPALFDRLAAATARVTARSSPASN